MPASAATPALPLYYSDPIVLLMLIFDNIFKAAIKKRLDTSVFV